MFLNIFSNADATGVSVKSREDKCSWSMTKLSFFFFFFFLLPQLKSLLIPSSPLPGSAAWSCVIVSPGIQINGLAVWLLHDLRTCTCVRCVRACVKRARGKRKSSSGGCVFFFFLPFVLYHKGAKQWYELPGWFQYNLHVEFLIQDQTWMGIWILQNFVKITRE